MINLVACSPHVAGPLTKAKMHPSKTQESEYTIMYPSCLIPMIMIQQ